MSHASDVWRFKQLWNNFNWKLTLFLLKYVLSHGLWSITFEQIAWRAFASTIVPYKSKAYFGIISKFHEVSCIYFVSSSLVDIFQLHVWENEWISKGNDREAVIPHFLEMKKISMENETRASISNLNHQPGRVMFLLVKQCDMLWCSGNIMISSLTYPHNVSRRKNGFVNPISMHLHFSQICLK